MSELEKEGTLKDDPKAKAPEGEKPAKTDPAKPLPKAKAPEGELIASGDNVPKAKPGCVVMVNKRGEYRQVINNAKKVKAFESMGFELVAKNAK